MHRKKGTVDLAIPPDIQKDSIVRFVLQGNSAIDNNDGSFLGVGDYDNESKSYKIKLHIHGKNYLSGREFAEIHLSKKLESTINSSLSEKQYAFAANRDVGGVPIIDKSIIKFKEKTAYTLAFSVRYGSTTSPRDFKLSFVYTDGSIYTPIKDTYASRLTECVSTDPEKTVDHICSYRGDGQVIGYTLADFGIYEGIHTIHAEVHEPYVGERIEISLDAPLYAIGAASDELDLLSGKITRKICTEKIDATAEIESTDEDGIFSISLKNQARRNSSVISPHGSLTDSTDTGIGLSDDGNSVLFKAPEGIDSVETLSEYLNANAFSIAYILNEPTVTSADISALDTCGKTILDVMTEISPKRCFIEYY